MWLRKAKHKCAVNGLFICLFSQFLGGPGTACVVEESVVDSTAKTFTTYTRNITYTTLGVVEEKCVYYVSPENESW